MKNTLIVALVAAVLAGGFGYYYWQWRQTHNVKSTSMTPKTTTLHIGAITVKAEVADTPELREKGLSNRPAIEEGQGMWFVFEEDGLWQFWMKDTVFPLDIIWADASKTIVYIAHDVMPESYPQGFVPESPARYVLEVPAGYAEKMGITEGWQIVEE